MYIQECRTQHGATDDNDVAEEENRLMSELRQIMIEKRALPPIILGSGRAALADKFKASAAALFSSCFCFLLLTKQQQQLQRQRQQQ